MKGSNLDSLLAKTRAVPGGLQLDQIQSDSVASEATDLVRQYLQSWEDKFLVDDYSQQERESIHQCLLDCVMKRYIRTGEISFTNSELSRAIALAKKYAYSKKKKTNDEFIGLCCDYVKLFINTWEKRYSYDEKEIDLIATKLYSFVVNRYQTSKLRELKLTKRELKSTMEFIERRRAVMAKNARADAKDREIRELRARYGSPESRFFVVHE